MPPLIVLGFHFQVFGCLVVNYGGHNSGRPNDPNNNKMSLIFQKIR